MGASQSMRQKSTITPWEERRVNKLRRKSSQSSESGVTRRGSLIGSGLEKISSGFKPKKRHITLFYSEGNEWNKASLRSLPVHFRYFSIIHPNGTFRRTFDFATVLWVLVLVYMIPFQIGFDWYKSSKVEKIFSDLLDLWFAIDIILNFRTGYIYHGTIVMDQKKIISNYLTSWFLVDILGTFPFERIITSGDLSSRKSLKLIKYFKIPKLLRVSRLLKYVRVQKFVYDVFQVIVLVFTFLHVGACVWMLILNPCQEIDGVTPDTELCAQDNVDRLYAESFHLSATMMLGVSNSHIIGDSLTLDMLTERRESQRILMYTTSTLFMISGLFLVALLIGELCVFLSGKMQGSATFQRKINRVKHEMEYYAVPAELQTQVKAFYDYIWIHQKQYDDRIALLSDDQMSTDLQRKLSLHLYKDVVSHISIFSNIDDLLLGEICLSLRTRIFLPDDMILFKGDVGKELFIIAKGVVEVLRDDLPEDQREKSSPIFLKSGSFFGEIALIMETRRLCSVQARTVCEVNILQQSTFDTILLGNPDFAHRMNELVVTRLDKISTTNQYGVGVQSPEDEKDVAMSIVEENMKRGLQRRLRRESGMSDVTCQMEQHMHDDSANTILRKSQERLLETEEHDGANPSSSNINNDEETQTRDDNSQTPFNPAPVFPSSIRRRSWSTNAAHHQSHRTKGDTMRPSFISERALLQHGRDEKDQQAFSIVDGEGEDAETMLVTGHFNPDRVIVDRKKVLPSILLHNDNDKHTIKKLEAQLELQADVVKTLLARMGPASQEGAPRERVMRNTSLI